jgi:hypothetical protein
VLTLSASPADYLAAFGNRRFVPRRLESTLTADQRYDVYISDIFNNPPGVGTQILFLAQGGCTVDFPPPNEADGGVPSVRVGDTGGRVGSFTIQLEVTGAETTVGSGGSVLIAARRETEATEEAIVFDEGGCFPTRPPDPNGLNTSP